MGDLRQFTASFYITLYNGAKLQIGTTIRKIFLIITGRQGMDKKINMLDLHRIRPYISHLSLTFLVAKLKKKKTLSA